jgi:hypothetical protein
MATYGSVSPHTVKKRSVKRKMQGCQNSCCALRETQSKELFTEKGTYATNQLRQTTTFYF